MQTVLLAFATGNLCSFFVERALHLLKLFILEPDHVEPVDTNRVRPTFSLVKRVRCGDRLENALDLRAVIAFDFIGLLVWISLQVPAAGTVPTIGRHTLKQLAAIAFLVHGADAQLTDQNLVAIIIVPFLADIADNVIVVVVFISLDRSVRVLLALILLSLSGLGCLNIFLINQRFLIVFYDSLGQCFLTKLALLCYLGVP